MSEKMHVRPDISEKSVYWLPKHRYYELKHFCLQYKEWRAMLVNIDGFSSRPYDKIPVKDDTIRDPTFDFATERKRLFDMIELVERVAKNTDEDLWNYILIGVTEGYSFDVLRARTGIPCCKDIYYNLYRRFFWLLSRERE